MNRPLPVFSLMPGGSPIRISSYYQVTTTLSMDGYRDSLVLYQALRSVRTAIPSPHFTPSAIDDLIKRCGEIQGGLPHLDLDAPERRRLQGFVSADSQSLVKAVAESLRFGGEACFPGTAPLAESLTFRRRRSDALKALQHLLTQMAARVGALALADLATATEDTLRIIAAVDEEASSVYSAHIHSSRAGVMIPAHQLVLEHQGQAATALPTIEQRPSEAVPPPGSIAGVRPDLAEALWPRFS